MSHCNSCEHLAKQLAKTEIKLAKVEKELDEANRIIKAVSTFTEHGATSAGAVMRRGNIGRAEYGFNHAEFDFGNEILGILGRPQIVLKGKLKGFLGVGQGLFDGIFGG